MEVRTDSVNLPKVDIATPIALKQISVSPLQISSGGHKIIVHAAGLGLSTTKDLSIVEYGVDPVCQEGTIELVDSSTVTCITRSDLSTDVGRIFKLQVSSLDLETSQISSTLLSCSSVPDCRVSPKEAYAPTISSVSNSGDDVTVEVGNYAFDDTYTVKIHLGKVSSTVPTVSGTSVTATFSDGIPPGTVPVSVSFEKDSELVFSIPSDQEFASLSPTISSSSTVCSFAGG